MYRISQRGEDIDEAGAIEGAREIVRGQPPGRGRAGTAREILSARGELE
jgi:hypothetical protein